MPDTKQYFISLPGFEDMGRWDVQTYEKKKHELFKKYPDAQIFEFSKYNADEEQGENDYYHIQLDGHEGEGVWDAKTFAEKKDKLFQKYPNAQVYRSRGVDYWYDKALADEESIKTMKEELEALTKEEYALPEEASVNPYDPELSPKEYEEFERQYTAHEQGRQSRKDHLAASIAETQEAYDANPRVIEAKERYEAEYAAALEEYKKNYLPNLRKQITDWKAKDVDALTAAKGASKKHNYGAGPHSDVSMWMAAFEGLSGEDVAEQYLEASEEERYNSALAFLNKAERIRKEHSSFGEGAKNTAMNWVEAWGSQSDLETYTEIYTILSGLEKKLGSLNDVSEADITSNLSRSEQALILAFFEYNAAQAEIQDDASWVYKAGGVATEAIPFVLEFIATGGLPSAASKGATKGLAKALTSWIKGATKGTLRRTARKVVAKGIRGTARGLTQAAIITPLRPTAYTNVTKAMTQIGEDGRLKDSGSDIAVAIADEYIETLSELSGGAITSVLGGIGKGVAKKFLSKGMYDTFATWGEKLSNLSGVKLAKSAQFHGLPVEMAEEYFGNALREMYDAKALDHMHEGDNFWSMLVGFLPLTVITGGIGVGQYVNAKNKVNKGAERLRDILAKEGYENDQINSLLALEGELSPYSLAEKLDPVLTSMAAAGASKESRDAVIKYAMDVVRYKTLEGTIKAQDATKRQEKLDELTGKLGTFYQTKNEGTQWQENVVTQATLYDGRTVFLTSAKNEMGEFAAVDAETGATMPVSESDIAVIENANTGESSLAVESQSLDTYLTSLVMGERKAAEEARMADEENTQIAALQERLKADPKVNIGTSDAPVIAVFQSGNANMAEFVLEDGSTKLLSWKEVGDYLNQPIRVLTDEQLAEAEAAEMEVEEAMMRTEYAETNEEMDKADESAELAMESEEKANPVNIPMNPDGSVNTDLFWDQNPEEWVKWNDQQRQDNGVDSMAQIAAGLQTAEAKLSEASKLPFATPTQREARDKEMGFWQDKINRYNALLEQYQLAAAAEEAQMARAYAAERLEAAEAVLADKMTQAPKRSDYRFTPQYMQAKQKFDAEVASLQEEVTRWQNELAQYGEAPVQQDEAVPVENVSVAEEQQPEEVAPSAEELAAQLDAMLMAGASRSDEAVVTAMQAYADAIASGVPAQVVTRKNVMQVLKDAGVSETKMAEVKGALRRIQYIVNGFEANGVAYMLAEGVISSEHLRGTYVHERQHIMTAVSGIDAALMTMTSREELQEAIAKLTNSNFYEGKGHMVLADELISMAMERAYKGENLDEVFEQIGFKNENAINFIKDIDNAQRNDSGLSLARVAGIGGNAAEGGSRQDGRTALSGSTEVGEQGPRSVGRGGETTGDNASGRGVGFSVSPDEGVAGMIENESGDAIAETNGGGGVRFSVLTYEQGGRDYLVNWLRKSKYMSKEERDFIIATLDQQYELAKKLGKEFPAFGAWSSAEVNVDKDGNPVMSVIKANRDYSMNLDFSLICKKRRPLNALLDVMIADRMLDMRSLNEAEIAKINKVIQRHGFEVACALCFVDSKRYRVVKVATDFADLYNELVNSLIPEGSGIEAVESNYAGYEYINERNAEKTGRRLETVPDAELNWAKVDEILEGVKTPKSVEEKVAWLLRNNPSQRKLVNATDFVTNLGFESVKKNNPELLKIYNAKKGTGGPKASFGDVQYLNDILKSRTFTPAKAYSVGGVRVQSFSDYMGHMFFDYMQMMAELSAKGLPAHAYTKEEAFARIFGMTGMKINMSLVPAVADDGVAPGLDAEGNYVWAVPYTDENGNEIQGQTFPPDVAFELQRDPRYSKNVGIIAVGVSDEHILKMLNDDQIHFVIPYHKSSLNPEVAKLTKIDKYADYTNVQNTRLGSEFANLDKDQKKSELKKRAFDFYKSLAKTKDPKATAAEYLEHCRQNGLIPKYDQFSGHENYYKLLVDFNTYDFNTGEYAPQGPVTMTFPEELESLVKASVASNEELESDLKDKVGKMAEDVKAELEGTRYSARTDEQRQALFDKAKAQFGLTNNFNAAGYMLPDGSLLDFSEANDGGNPNQRSQDHREIEGIIMDEGIEYDSRWMYLADFMNEGAIRLLPEYAGINLMKAPTKEQRQRLFDFIYKYNGEVILEIADERLNNVAYVEYDRRTSPSRIFRDIDGYFNKGIVPQQDTRFSASNNNQEIFVSNAAKAVEGIKQEKATPAQWLAMLEKNGGLKAAEDKWMGLSDWLKESDKKTLTKAEVLDFINENMIVIEEQHYNDMPLEDRENATFENLVEKYGEDFTRRLIGEAFIYEEGARGPYLSVNDPISATILYYEVTGEKISLDEEGLLTEEDYNKLVKWAAESVIRNASEIDGTRQINATRRNYTTDGLENLHEIALTVPTIEAWEEEDEVHFGDAGEGRAVAWIRFGDTKLTEVVNTDYQPKDDVEREIKDYIEYAMRHGDDLNTSIGYAYNQITDAPSEAVGWTEKAVDNVAKGMRGETIETAKVLVIDEIQSNRHQEGREKGYRQSELQPLLDEKKRIQEEWVAHQNKLKEKFNAAKDKGEQYEFTKDDLETREALDAKLYDIETRIEEYEAKVPDAPFDKNWHELAMKRMLRYAAENGYDYIAWTKGAQQAERYNIGTVVNSIEGRDYNERERIDALGNNREITLYQSHGETALYVSRADGRIYDYEGVGLGVSVENELLSDVVGKELADKLMADGDVNISNGELSIGGEGMKGFYDRMLPAFMNKYGKKWGIKVEDINLPNLEDGLTMHSVPVTEEMKASVMEGQTMFSVRTPAENKYTKEHLPNYMFDTDVRFSLSKNNRQTISGWLNKRGDLTEEVKTEVLDLLDQYNDATLQLCMGKWFAQGVISLPEDIDKCIQAVASAKKAKVNALSYPSPMSIIDQHGVIEKKQKPIDPDTVSTLKKSKVMDDGVVLYDVEESEESRQNLREIINTHYGANSSPWCLLQGDENGKLTEKSAGFWNEYSAVPKRVAFKDGKLLAFYASRSNQTTPWWDRFDRPWEGVPVSSKDKNDPLKREITRLVDDKTGKAGDEVSIIREEKFSDGSRAVAEWASMDPNDIRSYEKKTSSGRVTAGFEYQRALAEPGNPAFRFFANIFNRAIPKRLSWVSHNGESVQMDSMLGLTEYSMNDVSIDYTGDNISVVQVENYEENGEPRKYAKIYYDFSKSGNLVEAGVRDEQKEWVIITDKEELAQYEEQARPYFDMAKSAMEDPYKKMEEIKDRILDEAGLRFSVALNPEVRQEMDIIKATAMVNGNYMKAPNGQPTKLTEDQWALVRTNNFKNWFGDWENDPENASKVVDENGEPMVVYHGTAGSINKFENQQRSPGFWFVDREDVANGYAESASTEFEKEKNVVPVFLNIRNPRIEDARGEYPAEFALKSFVENDNGVYEVFDTYEEAEAYQKQNVPDGWIGAAEVGDQNDLVERAKEFGYDGVIMKNMHDQAAYAETRVKGPQTNYVALNPNQIKSATETTGLFSENEDIRFSAIVPHESSMDEIDQMFASLNRDPFVRDLYAKVSDLAHKMNLKIKFVEPWSEAGGANILDKVKYNVDYFNSNDYAQTKAGVLLHELIHSVTVYAVAAKNSSVLTQEMKDAVKQMEAIYDEIKDDPAFDGTYGAESVKEMVSELSNPRFRQKLRAKNLFQRIIDAIKQLLGIDKGTNALDNLEGTLEYMIENFDQNAFDAVLKANEQSDYYTRFSVRTKPAPKEVKRAYKLFNVDGEGKPHALFIDGANALDEKVWYDADSPLIKDLENLESGYTYYVDKDGNAERKTYKNKKQSPSKEELADAAAKGGRYIYVGTYANGEKSYYNWGVNGGKNGGSVSQFAMRPGWHLTDSPSARHIGAGRNPEAKQEAMYRKPNQRWFEVEYAADVDYNEEAKANPTGDIQTHIPEDGYYSFKTNTAANDVNQNWIISGAIRIVKPLTREEVSKLNEENGVPDDLDYENGTMFSVSERSVDEIVNDGVQKVSEEGKKAKASLKQRMDDIDSKLYYVMRMVAAAQKNYDKKTVDIMTNLAKDLMRDGALSDPTRGEINRLLAAIKNATGKADLTAAATTLMDVMVSNQLRHAKNTLAQMLKIKAKKVNASGVEAQGTLDLVGQRLIATVKESVGLTLEKIDERIADAKEKMDSEFDTIKNNAAIDLVGLNIARKYVDDVVASEAEEKDLRKELESAQEDKKAGKMTAEGLREFRKATEDAIRQNRIERTGAYRNILSEMAKLITESVTKAGQFRDAEKERVEKIHHYANSDLKGLPADAHTMKESAFWNSNIVRFFLKPLSSFEQMLKHFGSKNAEGKGYLYNHFIPGWVEASNKEFSGTMEAYSQLDAKAREAFGGKVKRWSDLFAVEKKRPAMTVKIWDDNKIKEYELSQGNLLYIYMVNKMTDGKMKLRKMGITEEDVRSIYNNLDPRFIEIAEWIQNDFLPSLRDKYNAVHERMFGAPMAAIDNYFPIRVLANARTRDVEVGTPEGNSNPSTITGNIIKRTKNSLALDVLGSDAFDVVLEHIQQMEHWAAFAEWNRDLNTLLSYKKFRNRVQNMSGIYGAGAKAWEEFRATAEIAAGVYRPKVSSMDKILNKVVRGLTAGKIGFRLWTAMKQILSAPAFAPYASPANILKNMVMPKASWDWAMENLEGFNKRWKSRDMGNVRLKKNASGIERWTDDWMDTMTRIGMTPNAFVDAVTCAIGAKSVYETAYAKYEEQGYSAEDAKKKAMVDATVAFNTTQQSGEGAFLSSLQADRDMVAYMTTTYRNANFGMGREFFDAARNLKHRMTPGYKEESLEFMTKQMMRDGLSEAKAKRAAERVYRNGIFKDSARVVTFGFVMQFLWNMGNSVIYQLFGDDDEDKKQMTEDAAFRALFGPIENLTFGNVILDGVMMAREGDMAKFNPSLSPAGQDLTRLIETLSTDPIAGVSDLVNIIFQSAIGTNPQVAADIALAIYDACDGDMETSKEVGIALLRILQAPQSQIDKLIEDEIDFTKDKGLDLTIEEFARRYAEYKRKKNAPYSFFLYSDEEERKVEDRYIKRFTKRAEELKRTRGNEEAKAWYNYIDNEYEEVSGTINELRRKAQKAAMRGDTLSAYEFAEQLNEFLNTPEVKRYEERAGRVKGEEKIRKAMKDMPQNREEFEDIALQLRKELVEEMQLSE